MRLPLRTLLVFAVAGAAGFWLAGALPWGPGGGAQRERLAAEVSELRQQLARAERLKQVDRRAGAELRSALLGAETRRAELERRLAVYRRVLVPERTAHGLGVEDLAVYGVPPHGTLQYRVVLAQGVQRDQVAAGSLELSLRGRLEGDWVDQPLDRVDYRFHYLHVAEGTLRLPPRVVPEELRVRLRPSGGQEAVERRFAWHSVYQAQPASLLHGG